MQLYYMNKLKQLLLYNYNIIKINKIFFYIYAIFL